MGEQDGDAHQVAHHGGGRRAGDAPSAPLDEHNVEAQVDRIVDNHGQRHQPRAAVDAHHGRESPHEDECRIAQQQHLHVVASQGQNLLVAAQQVCRLVGQQEAGHHGQHHSQPSAECEGAREVAPCQGGVALAQRIAHEHACTGIDEQVQGEDKLVDGLRQVNGTHTVLTDEVAHDDAINHVAQTARQCYQDVSRQVAIKLLVDVVVHVSYSKKPNPPMAVSMRST